MDTFIIQGGKKLAGVITVAGSKNATLAILGASVLVEGKLQLENIPRISDVAVMINILKGLGATVEWTGEHQLTIDNSVLDPDKLDESLVGKIRGSILFMGCLASRFKMIRMKTPGGCQIGSRPLDAHISSLASAGYTIKVDDNHYTITKTGLSQNEIVMSEFSVLATENVIIANVIGSGSITIKCAAADPSVQDVCRFLNAAGAAIKGIGTHTLTIERVAKMQPVSFTIVPDPIEAFTFMVLASATRSALTIQNVPVDFLSMELEKFKALGLVVHQKKSKKLFSRFYNVADITIEKHHGNLKAINKIHDMPYPGFSPDNLQPFALLLTQANGVSIVHDWMYDGRLRYVSELQKMGANINILDPHRILIIGPTSLYGREITSYDLRAGATVIIAALIAEGTSTIENIDQVDRGYEKLDKRLQALGADISRKSMI